MTALSLRESGSSTGHGESGHGERRLSDRRLEEAWTRPRRLAGAEDGPNEANFTLGTPVTGLAGQTYVVCWAHNPLEDTDFVVTIDPAAELHGPFVQPSPATHRKRV